MVAREDRQGAVRTETYKAAPEVHLVLLRPRLKVTFRNAKRGKKKPEPVRRVKAHTSWLLDPKKESYGVVVTTLMREGYTNISWDMHISGGRGGVRALSKCDTWAEFDSLPPEWLFFDTRGEILVNEEHPLAAPWVTES